MVSLRTDHHPRESLTIVRRTTTINAGRRLATAEPLDVQQEKSDGENQQPTGGGQLGKHVGLQEKRELGPEQSQRALKHQDRHDGETHADPKTGGKGN